mmetsp:Transcript_36221/g.41248  ORF Transcript_36221/g.41248 Transcript_36221/m.41248 type:complete len:429 (+) Transcript_36221:88-1374(+)
MAQPVIAYYAVQSYFAKKSDELNAFALNKRYNDVSDVTVADILESFPIDLNHFHIRFKTTIKDAEGRSIKLWLDCQNLQRVPTYKNSIIMKLLDTTPRQIHPISNKKYMEIGSHHAADVPKVHIHNPKDTQNTTSTGTSKKTTPSTHTSPHHLGHHHESSSSSSANRPSSLSPIAIRRAEEELSHSKPKTTTTTTTASSSSAKPTKGHTEDVKRQERHAVHHQHGQHGHHGHPRGVSQGHAPQTGGQKGSHHNANLLSDHDAFPGGKTGSIKGQGDPLLTPQVTEPVVFDRSALKKEKEQFVKDQAAAALKGHQDNETQLEETIEGKKDAHIKLGPKLEAWVSKGGAKKDIRTLLVTMHEVLWDGARWEPCGMGSLLAGGGVKKQYRKAILVVHPDRHQKDVPEVQYISERVFNALNDAFKTYTATES